MDEKREIKWQRRIPAVVEYGPVPEAFEDAHWTTQLFARPRIEVEPERWEDLPGGETGETITLGPEHVGQELRASVPRSNLS